MRLTTHNFDFNDRLSEEFRIYFLSRCENIERGRNVRHDSPILNIIYLCNRIYFYCLFSLKFCARIECCLQLGNYRYIVTEERG